MARIPLDTLAFCLVLLVLTCADAARGQNCTIGSTLSAALFGSSIEVSMAYSGSSLYLAVGPTPSAPREFNLYQCAFPACAAPTLASTTTLDDLAGSPAVAWQTLLWRPTGQPVYVVRRGATYDVVFCEDSTCKTTAAARRFALAAGTVSAEAAVAVPLRDATPSGTDDSVFVTMAQGANVTVVVCSPAATTCTSYAAQQPPGSTSYPALAIFGTNASSVCIVYGTPAGLLYLVRCDSAACASGGATLNTLPNPVRAIAVVYRTQIAAPLVVAATDAQLYSHTCKDAICQPMGFADLRPFDTMGATGLALSLGSGESSAYLALRGSDNMARLYRCTVQATLSVTSCQQFLSLDAGANVQPQLASSSQSQLMAALLGASGGLLTLAADEDGDGVLSGSVELGCDNCPLVPNPKQIDSNGDGIGNNCNCPLPSSPCNDGNQLDGDGCSALCVKEAGWVCSTYSKLVEEAVVCSAACGDGLKTDREGCDDGNLADGDGCSSACAVEFGWQCATPNVDQPSQCNLAYLLLQDTFVDATTPAVNYGLDSQLAVDNASATMLLMFEVSSLASSASQLELYDAFLQLQCGAVAASPKQLRAALRLYSLTSVAWNETDIAFDSAAATLFPAAQALALDSAPQLQSSQFDAIQLLLPVGDSVTDALRAGATNVTLLLNVTASGSASLLCLSADNSTTTSASRISARSGSGSFAGAPALRFVVRSQVATGGGGSDRSGLGSGGLAGVVVGSVLGGGLVLLALCCLLVTVVVAVVVLALVRRQRGSRGSGSSKAMQRELGLTSLEANAYSIDATDLTMVALLGRGAAGQVYRGVWRQGKGASTDVAIKRISLGDAASMSASEIASLEAESAMLSRMHHPNIMRFYGIACTSSDLLLVCELMHKGSLEALLQQQSDVPLAREQLLSFAADAARGLVYLHHESIVHRDIKPANMLISADNRLKLGDFGIARVHQANTATMTSQGTPHYMAPEVCRGLSSAGLPLDIYSLGVVFWEMAARQRPYARLSAAQIIYQVTQGGRPDVALMKADTPDGWRELVEQCWHDDPQQRPTADQVLERLLAMGA